jgi:D-inositol-3-phosphate glycosyltransferase
MHTSPLVQPGTGDGGGMNVYVRELVAALAQAGVGCQVYTRRWHPGLPDVVDIEPGFRVVHVDAGDPDLAKEDLLGSVGAFTEGVLRHLERHPVDAVHANYWLSGVAGHTVKHALDVPLVSTFHTLGAVKSRHGDPEPQQRICSEREVIGCSDAVIANASAEAEELVAHYDADPARIEVVPPGVDHAFFSPGEAAGARAALGLGDHPVLLFVGRIQPSSPPSWGCSSASASSRPNRTTCCRPSTGRPTQCSSRAAPRASASSRWRRPPAARR